MRILRLACFLFGFLLNLPSILRIISYDCSNLCAFELCNAVDAYDVRRLQTFLTLFDVKFDFFALVQRTITTVRILNRGKVNEQVFFATVRGNETIALAIVEPLDGALLFGHLCGASFLKCHAAESGGIKKGTVLHFPSAISALHFPTAVPCKDDYREIMTDVKWRTGFFSKLSSAGPVGSGVAQEPGSGWRSLMADINVWQSMRWMSSICS